MRAVEDERRRDRRAGPPGIRAVVDHAVARMIRRGAGASQEQRAPWLGPATEDAASGFHAGVLGEAGASRSRSEDEGGSMRAVEDERRRDRRAGPPGTRAVVDHAG